MGRQGRGLPWNLDIETSPGALSTLSSARLTPSPHRSPNFSAAAAMMGMLDKARENGPQTGGDSPTATREQPSGPDEVKLPLGREFNHRHESNGSDNRTACCWQSSGAEGSWNTWRPSLGAPVHIEKKTAQVAEKVTQAKGNIETTAAVAGSSAVGRSGMSVPVVNMSLLTLGAMGGGPVTMSRDGFDLNRDPVSAVATKKTGWRENPSEREAPGSREKAGMRGPSWQAESKKGSKKQPNGFLPMMALAQPGERRKMVEERLPQGQEPSRFSSQYHGMHNDSNASAEHLAPEQNCALWLTNLPADVDYGELLGAIRNVGRVWCSYINQPDNVQHQTAAAKVVFFKPEAAQLLLARSWSQPIVVRQHRVRVSHNRIKYGSNVIKGNASRVLIITGSIELVNVDSLREFFTQRFIFQEDRVKQLITAGGRAVCEFRFGSYRCQAQMGKMALEKDWPTGLQKVEFGEDPCEMGETLNSYFMACERIRGKGLL